MIWTRRALLRLAGRTAILGVLAWTGRFAIGQADARSSACFSAWRNPRSACEVGRRVLALYPNERDRQSLVALIGRRISAFAPHIGPGATTRALAAGGQLDHAVSAAVRDDFERGRIRVVHGWLLAETECRVCALAALEARHGQ